MNHEQAKCELERAQKKGALAKRLRRFGVPGVVKNLVRSALRHENQYPAFQVLEEHPGGLGPVFSGLSEQRLRKLIKTLLPTLAPAAEEAWDALRLRPFQLGAERRAFRCPNDETSVAIHRGRWLLQTAITLRHHEKDAVWVATWAAHLAGWSAASELGWLLAGSLNRGDAESNEVFSVLKASANGDHEIAQMGRHVTQALMSCNRADAWEFNEKLFLAAQRQEGLRQVVLESVDEAHPEAFRRMLRLILENDLSRFSSVLRAVVVWFGLPAGGVNGPKVNSVLERVLLYLEDQAERAGAICGDDPESAYLALWTIAFNNVDEVVAPAERLLSDGRKEIRLVAAHLLAQCAWKPAWSLLATVLDDEDLRVAACGLQVFQNDVSSWMDSAALFDSLERLMGRLSKRTVSLEPIVWPSLQVQLRKAAVAKAMSANRSGVPAGRMLPHVKNLDPWDRALFIWKLAGLKPRVSGGAPEKPAQLKGNVYDTIVDLLGDPSSEVRRAAFEALESTPVRESEVERLVGLLSRKAGDLRSRCIDRIRRLDDDAMFSVAERLLSDKDSMRRVAGLELVRDAVERGRDSETAKALADAYRSAHGTSTDTEQSHLAAISDGSTEVADTADALGLIEPAQLRRWPAPKKRDFAVSTAASGRCVESLAQLILRHRDHEFQSTAGEKTLLIDAFHHDVSRPIRNEEAAKKEASLPLLESWRAWQASRSDDLRDADGLELVRAWGARLDDAAWGGKSAQELAKLKHWGRGAEILRQILHWCIHWQGPSGPVEFAIDGVEHALARLTERDFSEMGQESGVAVQYYDKTPKPYQQKVELAANWVQRAESLRTVNSVDPLHWGRLYGLIRWFHRKGGCGLTIGLQQFSDAYRAGALGNQGVSEFMDLMIGSGGGERSRSWELVSGFKAPPVIAEFPELLEATDRCRRRVVEVEVARGDRVTAASSIAKRMRWSGGLEAVTSAMQALGATKFARSSSWGDSQFSRKETLSHIVLRSGPRPDDTVEDFVAWAELSKIKPGRLVELAAFAPQWAWLVNHVLGWDGFESAVWWIHAHTKDDRWQIKDLREMWAAQVSERTPLTAQDLTEGAVDVQWFHQAYSELGAERWEALYKAAKYASSSGGHKRAQLFASAMIGDVSKEELLERIEQKRHQDSVRALGLVPLASGDEERRDLLSRYECLQEYRRQSRQFGSQRQASEGRAMTIGLDNLARTAGFKDSLRLQWSMEMEAVKDLAMGPVIVSKDETVISLSIDEAGVPHLAVDKNGKKLRAVPAKLARDPEVVELKARLKELRRQASRVKQALEESMIRGDVFEGGEIQSLLRHPILSPSLGRLVLIGDGLIGYPVEQGRALRDHGGKAEPVGGRDRLRLAHPHDLLAGGDWSCWQRECLRSERIQPFKQVFRELYPVTEGEIEDKNKSRRYAGHQVNPRQALALLGSRGWVAHPEFGVSKTYHHEGVTARLGFDEAFFTPAEVEGLTLELVVFTKKGDFANLDLVSVAPQVFSETMRDLDLVVSVAHQGGVDPEATASTVEMRGALLQETCELLGLQNVEIKSSNVVVRGELGDYSIHLGSALVRLLGGPALAIAAVPSQHRGRVFLPFADDDPRTAEVLSKVLLLARDRKIKDPNILDQIRRATGD